jgi:hypothetical protein
MVTNPLFVILMRRGNCTTRSLTNLRANLFSEVDEVAGDHIPVLLGA